MPMQVQALGQKYMGGLRPSDLKHQMFQQDGQYHVDGSHPVPVNNFMNAQCEIHPSTLNSNSRC